METTGDELTDRIAALINSLKGEGEDGSKKCDVEFGIVHGDLNLRNFIGMENGERLWLIDFANTRPGPPAADFVTFETEIRFQMIVPCLLSAMDGESDPRTWYARAHSVLERFEELTQDENRVYMSMWEEREVKLHDESIAQVKQAWQMILRSRTRAFDTFYRGREGREIYDSVLALFVLRALQKYRNELIQKQGPLGTLWAAVILEKTLNHLHM